MVPTKMLPAPTKEEKRALRQAVKLYNEDLRQGVSPQEAAQNWHARNLWNGVGQLRALAQ